MKVVTFLALYACLPSAALAAGESPLAQVYSSEAAVRGPNNGSPEASAAAARDGFAERSGASAVKMRGRGERSFAAPQAETTPPARFEAAAKAPPAVYAAKANAEDKNTWDREGTLKAGAVGLGGAVIGFMLGGPIGACAGFLAAFFVGALLWKLGKI